MTTVKPKRRGIVLAFYNNIVNILFLRNVVNVIKYHKYLVLKEYLSLPDLLYRN